jgi:hypothetical protein
VKWQIPYQGRTWEYNDERITASEARLQKRLTGGLLPAQADRARQEMDPDAWVAALVIARRRSGMEPDEAAAVDADLVELMACMQATREAGEAELEELRARAGQESPAAADPVDEPEPAPA